MTVVEKQNNVMDKNKNKNWKSELGIVNALDLYFGRVQFDERDMNKIFPTPHESIRVWLAKCILVYQLYRRGDRVVMYPEIAGIETDDIDLLDIDTNIAYSLTEESMTFEEMAQKQFKYWNAGIEFVHIEIRNWNDDIGWMCEFVKAHIPK